MRATTFFPSGLLAVFAAVTGFASIGHAQVVVDMQRVDNTTTTALPFTSIPNPSNSDLLEGKSVLFQDGGAHSLSGGSGVLTDGNMPAGSSDLSNIFFFSDGGGGNGIITNGRLLFDLGSVDAITQINTYSWHSDSRAPQFFDVYGATGTEPGFSASPAVADGSPLSLGYTLIGHVDTSSLGLGGQQGSSIQMNGGGSLGNYRYILFDIFPADDNSGGNPTTDSQTNTFFTEMDVVGSAVPEPSTYGLVGIGAALTGILRQRRRSLGLS